MYLDYWMIAVMFGLFTVGLMHQSKYARAEGFNDGVKHGADLTLMLLQREKIITVDDLGEIEAVKNLIKE